MNYKIFKKLRILTAIFVSILVATAVTLNNFLLALAGVSISVLFLILVKRKTKAVLVDERIKAVSGHAARLTYVTLTIALATLSLVLMLLGRRLGESRLEFLGLTFSYLVLSSMVIYSVAYKYYVKKYGGQDKE